MYKHETVKIRLIGYLIFISVNWNLETTDRLTGYSVKVHSTNTNPVPSDISTWTEDVKIISITNHAWVVSNFKWKAEYLYKRNP